MFSREAFKQSWRDVRPYFWAAIVIFIAGVFVGGAAHTQITWLDQQIQSMGQISEQATNSDHPRRTLFLFIMINNIFKSIFSLYMGMIACILPILMLILNGLVLGYLFGGIAEQGTDIWPLILKGILPHGILELPAVFLASAYGILLGVEFMRGIYRSVRSKPAAWDRFVQIVKNSVPIVVVVTVMLIAAAVIESTFTYWLIK